MKKSAILSILILVLVSGCFAPLNSVFDNATLPQKNELRIIGSYSGYYGPDNEEGLIHLNDNLGFSLGYGFSDNFNLNFRYEYLDVKYEYDFWGINLASEKVNYFGLSSKINLKKDKLALGVPVGVYFADGEYLGIILDPMLYVTFRNSDKFEFNVIPKAHIGTQDISILPGISMGLGLSKNLDKWAIRPEIGYDGCLYFGMGMNVNFRKD